MFFIGIFGVNSRKKELKKVRFKCTGCLSEEATIIETSHVFEFFFIPIFSWNKNYYLKCVSCGSLYKLYNDHIGDILESGRVEYEDIERVVQESIQCPKCGTILTQEFSYCPKCGTKLK
jgi:uncharacterized paraquat-inducible protein A